MRSALGLPLVAVLAAPASVFLAGQETPQTANTRQ